MAKVNSNLAHRINEKVQTTFRDMELEYQLMAYLVRVHPKSCSIVRSEWFSDGLLQEMFEVVQEHRGICTKATITHMVKEKFSLEDPALIEECADDVFDADIDSVDTGGGVALIESVMRLAESRKMINSMAEMITNIKSWNLDEAKAAVKVLARPIGLTKGIEEGGYIADFDERVEIMSERAVHEPGETVGIPTGVEQFDKFSGGLIAPEFGVIAATTGTGKTVGLVDFALYSWLTGHNTLLITGEMDKVDLQFRMDMYLTEISGMKFRKGELEPEDFVKWDATVKQYKATHGDALLHVVSFTRGFTRDHIEDVIIRLQDSTGKQIKWLGIDYLNIMQPTNYSGDDMDWGAQANVVWDVKSLTQEYDLVTWTANQVKDEAFEKELFELSDLKYARAISEAAPVVVAFVRSDTDILAGRMKMQVMKMRNAVVPAKPFILHPDMSIMKINKPQPTGSKSLDDVGKAEKTRMVRKHKHTIAAKDTRRKTT